MVRITCNGYPWPPPGWKPMTPVERHRQDLLDYKQYLEEGEKLMTDNPEQPAVTVAITKSTLDDRLGYQLRGVPRHEISGLTDAIEELVRAVVREQTEAFSDGSYAYSQYQELERRVVKLEEEANNPLHDSAPVETCVNEFQPSGVLPSKEKQQYPEPPASPDRCTFIGDTPDGRQRCIWKEGHTWPAHFYWTGFKDAQGRKVEKQAEWCCPELRKAALLQGDATDTFWVRINRDDFTVHEMKYCPFCGVRRPNA